MRFTSEQIGAAIAAFVLGSFLLAGSGLIYLLPPVLQTAVWIGVVGLFVVAIACAAYDGRRMRP